MTILCADDFGLTQGISDGIIELGACGAIQVTSVMTEAAYVRGRKNALLDVGLSLGLHFNLTHAFSEPTFGLRRLMAARQLPTTERDAILQRLRQQLDCFEVIFKAPPDFIDGHQHVHCFPSIRGIFLEELAMRYSLGQRPWIRQVGGASFMPGAAIKGRIISFMNIGFKDDCIKSGFKTNDTFAGIYGFSPEADYGSFLKRWMQRPDTLIMCHPSKTIEAGDAISKARYNEYSMLKLHSV